MVHGIRKAGGAGPWMVMRQKLKWSIALEGASQIGHSGLFLLWGLLRTLNCSLDQATLLYLPPLPSHKSPYMEGEI